MLAGIEILTAKSEDEIEMVQYDCCAKHDPLGLGCGFTGLCKTRLAAINYPDIKMSRKSFRVKHRATKLPLEGGAWLDYNLHEPEWVIRNTFRQAISV